MFRYLIGGICFVAGAGFLIINSIILYRGAARFGHDDLDRTSMGIAAALVPWGIAALSVYAGSTLKTSRIWRWTFRRPTLATFPAIFVWCVFFAYNIIGGAGAIANVRQESIANVDRENDTTSADKERRDSLKDQRGRIPAHRPVETVESLLKAERARALYAVTKQCSEPATRAASAFCASYATLEAEAASARSFAELSQMINELDTQLSARTFIPVSDPQAALLSRVTGQRVDEVKLWLPAATPLVLEVGGAVFWAYAFAIFGVSMGPRPPLQQDRNEEAPPVASYAPVLMSPQAARSANMSLEALTAARAACGQWWRNSTRPVVGGALAEAEWYEIYEGYCRRGGLPVVPLETFARIGTSYVPRISDIDGVKTYFEVLPADA
jgi:hypothetical protein